MPESTLARSERALHGSERALSGSERALSGSERALSNCCTLHGRITKVTEPTGVPQADGPFGWQGLPRRPDPTGALKRLDSFDDRSLSRPERRPLSDCGPLNDRTLKVAGSTVATQVAGSIK